MANFLSPKTQKILVVDDDAAAREGLVTLLSEAGYTAMGAGTLKAAMETLERESPDLLITDVRLQGYNGLQLLAMAPRAIPAIVVTGYPDRMLETDAQKMGAEYLVKPVSPATLLSVVRHKMERARGVFSPVRRWTRRAVTTRLPAKIQDFPARILDVSYGGLRLEVDRALGARLPHSLCVSLPTSNMEIDVNVVWQRPSGSSGWLCGAEVPETSSPMWRQLVDGLAY